MSPLSHHHTCRAEPPEFRGDVQSADRAARHQNALADIGFGSPVIECRDDSRRAGECGQTRHRGDGRGPKSAGGHHHSVEALVHPVGRHLPPGTFATDTVHLCPEPDTCPEAEHVGVAVQVVEDVMVRQEDKVAFVLEVAEGRQHPTGVGVHGRPHPALARPARPLSAEFGILLEDRRLEPLRLQPSCRDEPARSGADHRDSSRHLTASHVSRRLRHRAKRFWGC